VTTLRIFNTFTKTSFLPRSCFFGAHSSLPSWEEAHHISCECHKNGSIHGSCSLAKAIRIHKQVGHITWTIQHKFSASLAKIVTSHLSKKSQNEILVPNIVSNNWANPKLFRNTHTTRRHAIPCTKKCADLTYLGSSWTIWAPLNYGCW
jgi:hypothetical protein